MTATQQLLGTDPGWIILVKGLIIFVICVVATLLCVWGERRIVAFMQMRVGPNRVGKFGLLQSLADGVKLALKELDFNSGIKVELLNSEFLIGPSFPKFSSTWATKATVKITVDKNASIGERSITIFVDKPSIENSTKWQKEFNQKYYETVDAGAEILETITINVV